VTRPSVPVSFRLSRELAALLDDARKPYGMSAGEYTRVVLTAALTERPDEDIAELRRSISDLAVDIERMEQALRKLMFLLLTACGGLSPDAARDAVHQTFSHDRNS
jgi:hypothetical protein